MLRYGELTGIQLTDIVRAVLRYGGPTAPV